MNKKQKLVYDVIKNVVDNEGIATLNTELFSGDNKQIAFEINFMYSDELEIDVYIYFEGDYVLISVSKTYTKLNETNTILRLETTTKELKSFEMMLHRIKVNGLSFNI